MVIDYFSGDPLWHGNRNALIPRYLKVTNVSGY